MGVSYLRRVHLQPRDVAVLALLVRAVVLRQPVEHLFTPGIIDAPDDPQGIEDEPGLRLPLHLHRDELHLLLESQTLEERDDPPMDDGTAQGLTEFECDTGRLHGQADRLLDFQDSAFLEPPDIEQLALVIVLTPSLVLAIREERKPQMPTAWDVYVVV
ncbi:hypothetical protein NR798_00225 [Archangium gephyra]|uniref:hypothetical protein n=1 Tax=Archangium gephyra TaxID=48 RepID=UPI0035D5210F